MSVFGFGDFSTSPKKGDGDKPKKPKKVLGVHVFLGCDACQKKRKKRRGLPKMSMN